MRKVSGTSSFSVFIFLILFLVPFWAEAARPILVEGAMDCETDVLIAELENPSEKRIGGWRFVSGEYQGVPVVVSVTSIGMANAAAATTLGIEYFHPAAVINQGTCGGHDPALHSYDIVLGVTTFDSSSWVSRKEKKGADGRHIELAPICYYDQDSKETKKTIELPADTELLETALGEAEFYQAGQIVRGKIATSNCINRQIDRIRHWHEEYGSSCEEMETYAAAQVCRNYGIPFLGIRVLSNAELYGEEFDPATATPCQQYVLTVIKAYAERKNLRQNAK